MALRELIDAYSKEIAELDTRIHLRLKGDPGHEAIQAIHGIGKVTAAAARNVLTLVYYGLRDGHIRCLEAQAE